jgi:hypothetical protein
MRTIQIRGDRLNARALVRNCEPRPRPARPGDEWLRVVANGRLVGYIDAQKWDVLRPHLADGPVEVNVLSAADAGRESGVQPTADRLDPDARRTRRSVLLVSRDPELRSRLLLDLARRSCPAIAVDDPDRAYVIALHAPPRIVVMDETMGRDAPVVGSRLRQALGPDAPPVLLLARDPRPVPPPGYSAVLPRQASADVILDVASREVPTAASS